MHIPQCIHAYPQNPYNRNSVTSREKNGQSRTTVVELVKSLLPQIWPELGEDQQILESSSTLNQYTFEIRTSFYF
jgi:hypothetical protein